WTVPPPAHWGERTEPWRARPVPFWRQGLRPPPRTSPRVLVLWVPCRAAASCATTTWWISGTLTWTSKTSPGSSTVPADPPCGLMMSMVGTSGSLHGVADEDDPAARAGDGALDEQQPLLGVDGVDLQVLGGLAHAAHAAGHAHPLEDAARGGAATDGAGLAVVAVRTVGGADTGEPVALHDAGEALALRFAGDVDALSGLEQLCGHLLTTC